VPRLPFALANQVAITIAAAANVATGAGTTLEDRADLASHPAAVLSDGSCAVFAKLEEGDGAEERLEREVAGLRLLTDSSGVRTPTVLGLLDVPGGTLLVMEAVDLVEREPVHWRQMGRVLACIHAVQGDRFGLDTHCYWGGLHQDNRPLDSWPEFFWQRRCVPRLQAALDSGNLPASVVPEIEKLEPLLPRLCGPEVRPTLLHGDAQQNNFLSTAEGPVLIDPSVYYGHPEIDLAYVDFFAPVSDELFAGYRERARIDPGFPDRRDLWLIPVWLGMVEVEGQKHLDGLLSALRQFV
jgi:fructosamine-3-kinase